MFEYIFQTRLIKLNYYENKCHIYNPFQKDTFLGQFNIIH